MDERLLEAFRRAAGTGEMGIQAAAYLGDELIVDEWYGVADPTTGREVDGDTLFMPYSVTKAVVAVALHIQAERGLVDYEAPITRYWKEYGANGKEDTTVRDALTHRAGVPQMPDGVTPELMSNWDWMTGQIAQLNPMFPPGTTNAYHSLSWGWIVGEIVRRTDPEGRDLSSFVQDEICEALEIRDMYLGAPASEHPRIAPSLAAHAPRPASSSDFERSIPVSVYPSVPVHNRPDIRSACLPGAGIITTARAMARLFAMLAQGGQFRGVRLLSENRVRSFLEPRQDTYRPDALVHKVFLVGSGGFRISGPTSPPADPVVGLGRDVLWHPGSGGSVGWADLGLGLGVAICHNWMQGADYPEPPFLPLGDAIRSVAEER